MPSIPVPQLAPVRAPTRVLEFGVLGFTRDLSKYVVELSIGLS